MTRFTGLLLALVSWALAPHDGMAQNMSSQNAAAPAASLVITGASYAGGWKTPSLPGFSSVANKGVSGEETHQVLARFDRDVLAARPSAVLIWGHINNVHRAPADGIDPAMERAKSDYREMVSRARANGIAVYLATEVTLSEPAGLGNWVASILGKIRGKQSYTDYVNGHVRSVNEWLRAYARDERIPLLDFEKAFDDGSGYRRAEYTTPDGTHINAAGYTALTAYAQTQLRSRQPR